MVQSHDGVQPRCVRVWSGAELKVAQTIRKGLQHMKSAKSIYSRPKYNNRQSATKPDGNPFGFTLHRLVSIHDCLLVDDDLRRVGFRPADS